MKIEVSTAAGAHIIDADPADALLTAIRKAGLAVPGAACGGKGSCGKCWVTADGERVLSCKTKCAGVSKVTIPEPEEIRALTRGAADIAGGGSGLGVAVDIGTTTVAAFLYDMETGKLLARASSRNAQRSYGADAISRIQAWSEGHGEALTACIRAQLCELTAELCSEVSFVTTQELEDMYPDLDSKGRENAYLREHKCAFIMGIGDKLKSGKPHDGRAPDYDDWTMNGDILFWSDILGCAVEVSSMGIRVDEAALDSQLNKANANERREMLFHKMLLSGELPLTMGGGVGQSRVCMMILEKAHVGEVGTGEKQAAIDSGNAIGQGDCAQIRAAHEHTAPQRVDAIGDDDLGDPLAVAEGHITDLGDGIGNM